MTFEIDDGVAAGACVILVGVSDVELDVDVDVGVDDVTDGIEEVDDDDGKDVGTLCKNATSGAGLPDILTGRTRNRFGHDAHTSFGFEHGPCWLYCIWQYFNKCLCSCTWS